MNFCAIYKVPAPPPLPSILSKGPPPPPPPPGHKNDGKTSDLTDSQKAALEKLRYIKHIKLMCLMLMTIYFRKEIFIYINKLKF